MLIGCLKLREHCIDIDNSNKMNQIIFYRFFFKMKKKSIQISFVPVQARKELRKGTQTVWHERNNWLLCPALIFKSIRCWWNGGGGDELDTNTQHTLQQTTAKSYGISPNDWMCWAVLCCAMVSHARFERSHSNQHEYTCMHTHYFHMITSANKHIHSSKHTEK